MSRSQKNPQESSVEMRELVLPNDTNSHGNVLGGKVLHLMDLACAMVAMRHCRRPVVTAAMDNVEFLAPIPGGHFMILKAMVNYTGRSSMEIGVRVEGEDPRTGDITHTSSAYLSFVALDDLKNPVEVPELIPSSEEEKRRFQEAAQRAQLRKEHRRD
ncbi:MAG: acyl-CoA thioesterase [Planctomycetia bacterium]|jgi:acyl-CoA hydrolase|nr:acyl-CoA thioesterase [Planctomycetia bacterium]MBL6914090.1 acyl-CoA thioesterase [Planctomycetota bacterium]HCW44768.1 acyl-CoA thioesterase [Planctomycetota bacterium]